MRAFLPACMLALAVPVSAAPCDPAEHRWTPARYYDQNEYVFHEGHWYRSQHWQSGHEPSAGLSFPWVAVEAGPEDCSVDAQEQSPQAASSSQEAGPPDTSAPEKAVGRPVTVTPLKLQATPGDAQKAAGAQSGAADKPTGKGGAAGTPGNESVDIGAVRYGAPAIGPAVEAQVNVSRPAAEALREPEPVVCFAVPDWSYSQTYYPGDKVVYEGVLFRARRDTLGDIPGSDLPPAWNPLGPCK
ncbi:MAG: hypothetical protein D6758_13455 [Gammaproteobacteria bacterium]|nr:MAG: hypothetical protein D6758_13455 [Gammaproteobacteria bacterium]